MSKTSVIAHPPQNDLVIVRKSYIDICNVEHPEYGTAPDANCAAALLNDFEYWQNYKFAHASQKAIENEIASRGGLPAQDTDLWIYKKQSDLKENLFNIWGMNKVRDNLNWLVNVGYIWQRNNPKYAWDRTLQYQLNIDAVQKQIDALINRSVENNESKELNQRIEAQQSNEAIPENTTENTTEENIHTDADGSFAFAASSKSWTVRQWEDYRDLLNEYNADVVKDAIQHLYSHATPVTPRDIAQHLTGNPAPTADDSADVFTMASEVMKAFNIEGQVTEATQRQARESARQLMSVGLGNDDIAPFVAWVFEQANGKWTPSIPSLVKNGRPNQWMAQRSKPASPANRHPDEEAFLEMRRQQIAQRKQFEDFLQNDPEFLELVESKRVKYD